MTIRQKAGIALVLVFATVVLLWFSYPEHWLKHVSKFATVTVDDRPVPAEAYLGHPTDNEASVSVGEHKWRRRLHVQLRRGIVSASVGERVCSLA
jgi:hypothetical protein